MTIIIETEPRAKVAYLDKTVLQASLERIRWVYANHDHVGVNYSGGKDSTVVLGLTLQVARELGRTPVDVLFIDQEAEWRATVEHMRVVRELPDVKLWWFQVPMRISSAVSPYVQWLHCWEEGVPWMREKEPGAITENTLATPTFKDMFAAWQREQHAGESAAQIAGVRAEESPARRLGLTTYETRRGQTWGTKGSKGELHYTWYPIYDWRLPDVWKAIYEHGWPYNDLYDTLYRYGVGPRKMRVSSLHHESALSTLFMLQEVEPDTWDAMSDRLVGVNAAGHLDWTGFRVKELPPMFRSWEEYRDHLLENLIVDAEDRERLRDRFVRTDRRYRHDPQAYSELLHCEIGLLLVGDTHGTKLTVFEASHLGKSSNRGRNSGRA